MWGLICASMSAVTYFFMVILNKQSRRIIGIENYVIPEASIPWILILGFVNTGIGCYLYFSSLSQLSAQSVAVCVYIEPMAAVIFAALILNEHMSAVQIAGAVFIIGGAMIGALANTKKKSI